MKVNIFFLLSFLFLIILLINDINCKTSICKLKKAFHFIIDNSYHLTHCLKYDYCIKCMEIEENSHPNCEDCPSSLILKGYKIKSPDETLDELIKEKKSIVRFGDGEFDIIFGNNIPFQNTSEKLMKKLNEILQSDEKDLLIGIYNAVNSKYLKKYGDLAKSFWINYNEKNKFKLYKLLNKSKQYYSTQFTRFYYDYKKKRGIKKYVKKLKTLWDKKDILIIEGEKSRLGIGNDLFDNTKSIQRIICPNENAFDFYDKILKETLKVNKNKLILISLGPTAKVLGYDLYKYGYQVIDVGHVDIEYEWFRRKIKSKVPIKNKYVNEARGIGGASNIENVEDINYYKQIISKVL